MIRSDAFDRFAAQWEDGLRAGLLAAGYEYQAAVKTRLMEGYTTGDFSHGGAGVAGTVTVGGVSKGPDGYTLEVGTNVPYALYWEMGHYNRFTRRYERVEVWREALERSGESMEAAFARVFIRASDGQTPPTVQFYADAPAYQGPVPAPGFTTRKAAP